MSRVKRACQTAARSRAAGSDSTRMFSMVKGEARRIWKKKARRRGGIQGGRRRGGRAGGGARRGRGNQRRCRQAREVEIAAHLARELRIEAEAALSIAGQHGAATRRDVARQCSVSRMI